MTKNHITIKSVMVCAILLMGTYAAHAAGVSAPSFSLPALDGKHYSDRYLQGGPTLVVFWASWCPVCKVELPKLHALYDEAHDRGLRVLAIGFDDDEDKIRYYVQAHSDIFDFPVLYDDQDKVAKRFGVFGTPTIYLVDGLGKIEYVTWLIDDPALKYKLEKLLVRDTVEHSS